jgi:hypothetical protein
MKIYISGPITGRPLSLCRAEFAEAASKIRKTGHEPVNPCLLQDILNPETTSWEQYMEAALGLLRACESIYFLPRWEKSKGCRAEYYEAMSGRKTIFYQLSEIPGGTEGTDGKNAKT